MLEISRSKELPMHDVFQRVLSRTLPVRKEETQNYVNQFVTPELEGLASSLIQRLAYLQNSIKKRYPDCSQHIDSSSRYLVLGLREVSRYLQPRQIQSVLVAKNIQSSSQKDGLQDQVQKIVDDAADASVPIIFALTRRSLSRLIFGHDRAAISCIGIMNVDKFEEWHQTLLESAWQNRIIWRTAFSMKRSPLFNSRNETPLWVAVYYGYRDPFLLQEILRAGYFLDEPDACQGHTPLMLAIQKNRLQWVKDILLHKPDLSLKSYLGRNVFWFACSVRSEELWNVLYDAACQRHSVEQIQKWINEKDVTGCSALDEGVAFTLVTKIAPCALTL